MNKSRGRPAGGTSDGRERLLAAARELFAVHGYDGTTLRMLGARAGCDPALVAYHFGSKKGLFAQAMALTLGPSAVLEKALEGDPATLAERLAAYVIQAWDRPEVGASLTELVRTAMTHPEVLRAFREYVEAEILGRLVEYLGGGPAATEQATALVTVVIGIVFGRYVLGIEPLSTMSPQRYRHALRPMLRTLGA
ncbi:TetR/AcrR family transcriptional regulator [Cellulomonas fengjieae]|uniref:TetR family transcriptional regulator n=1 Tax=Cellulomonas fengjieae TaxID=2819978 RepID=A0ABS3SKU2_9CELL|nr:TetR family transcriptional regulator [Cellulomonas fengjieae]MBO3086282.1 TetR family transcriptional regulator [Cellulomonas fengjieae]QVI65677.1 TetR family transcriptional regulator [Cellulomonas fengjieae]